MPYPVRYSTRAYIEYKEIIEYVFNKFGVLSVTKVDTYFDEVIDLIAINPLLYPYTDKKKNLRRCVVSPQTTIYYRFSGEYIELVSFRGNRMDPQTLGL
ncbi:MAG: hypothetical protein MI922_16290 [Bacteroidales bacterium]|nr:hypothetical protein [Bacteroidales bacterium]